jgi:enoyl-CoA hydratase
LARLVGPSRAKDLILSGRQVRAEEAFRIGLADEVVEPEELESRALALAATFASGPVQAHAIAKRVIDAGLEGSLADGLELEQDGFIEVFGTNDARIGVASFLENGPGKAQFTGQ